MSLPVNIWPMPVEIPDPIRFDEDVQHHSYVAEQANRFWRILVQVERVFSASRATFVGKCSPVNFFWGSFDLAITRFSGRPAPPREGPAFMREAYSHEVISHGFWPGSGPVLEPAFYAYAVPPPDGLKDARVRPDAAYYHQELGEFILPYEAVRTAASPDAAIQAFMESTYDAAANLGRWDRAALERPRGAGLILHRVARKRRTTSDGSWWRASTASFIACMSSAEICPASPSSARRTAGYRRSVADRATGTASYGGK